MLNENLYKFKDDDDFRKFLNANDIENAKQKSLLENRIQNIRTKKTINKLKKQAKALIAVGVVIITLATAGLIRDNSKKNKEIKNTITKELEDENNTIENIVKSSTHRTSDNKGTWIDYQNIAEEINKSDNKDLYIFSLYENYGKSENPIYNNITDNTLKYIDKNENEKYQGFDDYINNLGVNNKKQYEDKMEKYIYSLANYENSTEGLNINNEGGVSIGK